jgi:hypothetical protein
MQQVDTEIRTAQKLFSNHKHVQITMNILSATFIQEICTADITVKTSCSILFGFKHLDTTTYSRPVGWPNLPSLT